MRQTKIFGNTLVKVFFLSICFFISSCATVGKPFDTEKILFIQSGTTHKSEVLKVLGSPWRKGLENGNLTWTYAHYRYSAFAPLKSNDLVIKFEPNGLVKTYTFNTSEDIPKP